MRAPAVRRAVLKQPPESALVRACLELLAARGVYAFRVNQQGVPIAGKPGKYRPGPTRGVSDILGVLPGGRFLAVECKRKGGKVTSDQIGFLNYVKEFGGLAVVAYSVDDLDRTLRGLRREA